MNRSSLGACFAAVAMGIAITSSALGLSCTTSNTVSASAIETQIVQTNASPSRLATDGTTLFWVDDLNDQLWSAPASGGTPTAIYKDKKVGFVWVDATNVYFTAFTTETTDGGPDATANLLWKLPKSGGTATLVPGVIDIETATVHNGNLYWVERQPETGLSPVDVNSMPLGGGAVTKLASKLNADPNRIVVTATSVFLLDIVAASVSVFPVTGLPAGQQPKTDFVPGNQPFEAYADDTTVYLSMGLPTVYTVADDLTFATLNLGKAVGTMGFDGANLYFIDDSPGIYRVAKTGGNATQITTDARPTSFAFDSSFIYVADAQNTIFRAPK
jgi:hypothetical protein